MVEHHAVNVVVPGSSPGGGVNFLRKFTGSQISRKSDDGVKSLRDFSAHKNCAAVLGTA
jgi:hypothetical protein